MIPKEWKMMEFKPLLMEIVKLFKPKTYVELGVKNGYTFNSISPLVKLAIGVDVVDSPKIIKRKNVRFIKSSTDEAIKNWKTSIDFLFIDADHKKEQVLKDFNNYSGWVTEGTGMIALHDTHPYIKELLIDTKCSNSWEAAWEIRTNPAYKNFEILTFPGPYAGLSLIRKSSTQLSWGGE